MPDTAASRVKGGWQGFRMASSSLSFSSISPLVLLS